jgi:hypothetical protein
MHLGITPTLLTREMVKPCVLHLSQFSLPQRLTSFSLDTFMHSKFFLSPFTLFPFFLSQNVQYLLESTNNTINPHSLYPSLFSERTCPVNNFKCDPAGITHFNVGDAGASLYTTWLKAQPWSREYPFSFLSAGL